MAREWWSSGFFDMQLAEVLFDKARLNAAKTEAADILKLTGLKKGAKVLDAACGIGRHALEFARRGCEVTGVDASAAYVKAATASARKQKLKGVAFERGELRDLMRFQGSYDLVVNLFTSFGYYRESKDNQECLRQMAGALRPGGTLVMELMVRETLVKFTERDWYATNKGFVLERRSSDAGLRRLKSQWIYITKSGWREAEFELQIYSAQELKRLFQRAGLSRIRVWSNFKKQPFKMGRRLVILGTKA